MIPTSFPSLVSAFSFCTALQELLLPAGFLLSAPGPDLPFIRKDFSPNALGSGSLLEQSQQPLSVSLLRKAPEM